MAIELTRHQGRPHATNFALELLADEHATVLDRAAVSAIASIGFREGPEASALECAFMYLCELRLGFGA
jgi:hypothetical protein